MTGQTLSHYKILATIGDDATGTLYKAADTTAGRVVAIKALSPTITADAERRGRLERDAGAVSALEHPNIARVHEFLQIDGADYVVMDAPEGESVYDFLERQRPHRRYLLRFAKEIAGALEAAHAAGVIHGPLNPAALFISPKRHIKFHDFGFGVLEPPPKSEEARRALFGPAAPYVSPEQIQGARPDISSDVFSFGALLYHLSAGHWPFRGGTVSETWKAILDDEPKPIAQITSRAPRGMDKLLERCLRKSPQRRFQQIGEVLPLLEKMVDAYFENPKQRVSFVRRNSGRVAKIAAVALCAAAAVAGAVFWWQHGSIEEPILGKRLRQVTNNSGYDTDPVLSKDGTLLAYASDRNGGNLDIWVQPASGGQPRRLTTDPADEREPSFSPDGEAIAFRSDRGAGGVYIVSTKGGEPRLIAPEGRRPRYSPDGRWIAYWTGPPGFAPRPDRGYKMFVIPSGGGAPRQIQPDFAAAMYPIWSPDSKYLLFVGRADATRGDRNAVDWWVTALDGDRSLNTGACGSFHLTGALPEADCGIPGDWKGNHVFFSVPATGASRLWQADIASGNFAISTRPVRVTSGEAIETQPFANADGHIVFSRESYNADIWGVPALPNEGKVTGEARRWTRDPAADVSPSLSTDGARLLFQSNRTGHYNVWMLDVKSGKESPVKPSPQEQLWPLISPDGARIAFSEMRIGRMEHFYKSIGSAATEVLCEQCGPAVSAWSRDGSMVLIDSFSGIRSRLAVSLIKLPNRETTVLLADPQYDLNQARLSPDERWIAFTARMDGGSARLFVAPFHGPSPTPSREWMALTDGTAWDTAPQWSPDGKLVYFSSSRDGHRCVWVQRLDGNGKPSGQAFGIAHFHNERRSAAQLPFDDMDLFVGRDQILVSLAERAGDIWSARVSE